MATLFLVRHGETLWNRQGRVQGWPPTRLTDRGREQAAALGRSSPRSTASTASTPRTSPRALETAARVDDVVRENATPFLPP